jgi:hypothetical protein
MTYIKSKVYIFRARSIRDTDVWMKDGDASKSKLTVTMSKGLRGAANGFQCTKGTTKEYQHKIPQNKLGYNL